LQKGSNDYRATVAKYCIQDCELVNNLIMKLEVMASNMGMSNVCAVPLSYIFMRGQGIKIFSLVLKECKKEGYVAPVIKPSSSEFDQDDSEEDPSYEGAMVFDPQEGIYMNDPVSVLDYASLYPNSMISHNLSHDCLIMEEKYANVDYLEVTYDLYGKHISKIGEKRCRFAQLPNEEKGLIPKILVKLLAARKSTRKNVELKRVKMKNNEELVGFYNNGYVCVCEKR